jgi:hypothetical protein
MRIEFDRPAATNPFATRSRQRGLQQENWQRRGALPSNVIEDVHMKIAIAGATALLLSGGLVFAQGDPSGRGSTVGDPAASSANPTTDPTARGRSATNPSGSGTSTSGGRDDNGDQGRDKMPETAKQPTPQAQQKGLPK